MTPLQLAAACAAYEEIVGAGPAPALRVRFAAMTAAFATAERLAPASALTDEPNRIVIHDFRGMLTNCISAATTEKRREFCDALLRGIEYEINAAKVERLAPAQVTVPRELLEHVLAEMESDFAQIDGEWGPTPGGLEGAIKCGEAEAIRQLREVLK